MATYICDVLSTSDQETSTDESTTCDDEGGGTSSSDSEADEPISGFQFISPKPPVTTITKHAEISSTEKFVCTKKFSQGVNLKTQEDMDNRLSSPYTVSQSVLTPSGSSLGTTIQSQTSHSHTSPRMTDDVMTSGGSSNEAHLMDCEECLSSAYQGRKTWDYNSDDQIRTRVTTGNQLDDAIITGESNTQRLQYQDTKSDGGKSDLLQDAQIYGTRPKKRLMLSLSEDDSLGVRFVLANSTDNPLDTVENNTQQRKVLATRVAQLANQVFGLEPNTPSTQEHTLPHTASQFQNSHLSQTIEDDKQTLIRAHVFSSNECTNLTVENQTYEQPPLLKSPEIKSPMLPHSMMADTRAIRREVLTNGSFKKKRQLPVVTQDSSRSVVPSPLPAYLPDFSWTGGCSSTADVPQCDCTTSTAAEMTKQSTEISDDVASQPLIDDSQACVRTSSRFSSRPDSLDLPSVSESAIRQPSNEVTLPQTVHATLIGGTLISGDGTPTHTPSDSGLVNPGFVFDFPKSPTTESTGNDSVFSSTVKPVPSPSLLDVLHKKYWANNSPSSTLRKKKSIEEPLATSVFRSRHESYCRVVDQNLNAQSSFNTLPIIHSSKVADGSDPAAIKMFGDVSLMFNTLPARGSHEQRKRTGSMSEGVGDVERSESADKLSVPGQLASTLGVNNASSNSKLTRKFSLSPKVLRRKIIARLQPGSTDQSEKSQSTESEADDWLTARFRKDSAQTRRKELEIEALEACSWLQQAGFPQYVQLFEDNKFPVDLQSVETDHSFLDDQLLQSLYRRLTTLNKSVHMKLDINNKKPLYGSGVEEDDDEGACVLSDRWQYERESGRWSHIDTIPNSHNTTQRMRSCSSRDSVMTDDTTGEETGDSASPLLQSKNNNNTMVRGGASERLTVKIVSPAAAEVSSNHSGSSSNVSPKGQQTLEKKRNGSFFQRSLNRKSSKKTSRDKLPVSGNLTISGPVLVNPADMSEKIQRLGCVEIDTNQRQRDDLRNNNTSKPLLRSASTDDATLQCDRCSVDTTITEYLLPEDYKLGTFPKELVETKIPSRQNSISSRTLTRNGNHDNPCPHQIQSTTTLRNVKPNERIRSNRHSIYDNLPQDIETEQSHQLPAAVSPPHTEKETATAARLELDAVLHDLLININNLDLDNDDSTSNMSDLFSYSVTTPTSTIHTQNSDTSSHNLQTDSAIVSPTSEELSSLPATPGAPSTPREPSSPTAEQVDRLESSEELTTADLDVDEGEEGIDSEIRETIWRERRDSGVGSSLTREPLERKKKVRLRWHSFVASHRPSFNSQNLHISSLSAGQLMFLKRLSLLKVTSMMEQYSPTHKSGFSLQLVNRFMKKGSRTPDYNEKQVFGVPLSLILQRTGQPLPQCILHAMRYLRKSAPESVGIFRKSGVKSRIQKLRNDLEQDPDCATQFDSMQAYDVADMFKQYLRELPECLVTNKLSDTFLAIYQHVPQELRLEALQSCVLLLPDENREVLESLLYFLSDMAAYHEENQMTASNLAMCFAPSLFNIHNRSQSKSPKSDRKNIGLPDQKEFQEQRSATDCLTSMITDCKKVFRIPEDFLNKCSSSSSYMEAGEPAPLSLLGAGPDYQAHIESCVQGLLKESKEKGWASVPPPTGTLTPGNEAIDISYKKVHDGNPLRLWKCSTEIEAPPTEVLNRVLNERHKWDEDFSKWRVVEKLDTQLDIFQYVCNSMAPQPSREYITLRAWKHDLPKGSCALVMHSIDHETNSLGGGIRGIVLASHYLIEPTTAGKSKLTHISRIDSRGRQAKWYNKSYGAVAANNLNRVRESFTKTNAVNVHETKV